MIYKWLTAKAFGLARGLWMLIGLALLVLAIWWLVGSLMGGKRASTEARLGKNTTDAAIKSGGDAVNTVGNRAASDAATDKETQDVQSKIKNAPDAGAADAAARAGLHPKPTDPQR